MNDRIDAVIALSVRNGKDPYQNSWVGFAKQVIFAKFGSPSKTTKDDIEVLVAAWRTNRWKDLVKNNPYLTKGEVETWTKLH